METQATAGRRLVAVFDKAVKTLIVTGHRFFTWNFKELRLSVSIQRKISPLANQFVLFYVA